MSHDPQGQIWGQNQGKKVIASKRADYENLLTEMKSWGHFLQNDTKLVEIPKWLFWWVPPFFTKTPIFEGAYLQNYIPDFYKIENWGFLLELYQQTKFHANRRW